MSVVWTNPLVATLGMSLTIPLAMLADMVVHGRHYSFIYILGSAQVRVANVSALLKLLVNGTSSCISYLAYHLNNGHLTCVRIVHWCALPLSSLLQVFAGFVIANLTERFSKKLGV
jgi:hypothetical protein